MNRSEADQKELQDKFQEVAEAYEVLSDEELRGKYDRGEDVFENQGGGGQRQGFNPSVVADAALSLEQHQTARESRARTPLTQRRCGLRVRRFGGGGQRFTFRHG